MTYGKFSFGAGKTFDLEERNLTSPMSRERLPLRRGKEIAKKAKQGSPFLSP